MTKRRKLLKSLMAMPLLAASAPSSFSQARQHPDTPACSRLKLSLNAYSFNAPLTKGEMDVDDLIDFCANNGFDGVDITAYYFPGYPAIPPDEYIYHIKKKAFLAGLEISGTGVRNDFTDPDPAKRKAHLDLVKAWIECAAKLGAPVIRIFAGTQEPAGYTWDQVAKWLVADVKECVEHGKKYGVVVAIQNHHDFLKTSDQVLKIIEMVDSEWFGLILDTGSYRKGDPYAEIMKTIDHAVNWQVKEKIFVDGVEVETDLPKLAAIIKASCYKGYLPIETLGAGEPKLKVRMLLEKLRRALA
ncbi:MAG: sugar phosphate isomerase/epimerase family protein [Saprospiraceae bacterium]